MPDGTRCAIVTARHAIEVEFGPKWKEAIRQSLHYAALSDRIAGILLILVEPSEERYLERLREVIAHYNLPIDVRAIASGGSHPFFPRLSYQRPYWVAR